MAHPEVTREPPKLAPDAEAMLQQSKAVEAECERQDKLLMQDALRLLKKDRLSLQDISETFLLRRLLVAAFGKSATERQWAMSQLLTLKGMKKGRGRPSAEDDQERLEILDRLKPGG